MNATEEWLRYIENRVMHDRYGVNGYSETKESEEDEKSEKNTKETNDV